MRTVAAFLLLVLGGTTGCQADDSSDGSYTGWGGDDGGGDDGGSDDGGSDGDGSDDGGSDDGGNDDGGSDDGGSDDGGSDGGSGSGDGSGDDGTSECDSGNWSFFVVSLEYIDSVDGLENEGLGGDLGGLEGADAMCQEAADAVGGCDKTWVAFLSTSTVDAIDRIGEGPWYDVNGYLLAEDKVGLVQPRPDGDDQTEVWNDGWNWWVFTDCLTTELGNCNHDYGDSHDTLTGSSQNGRLYGNDPKYTCDDWTSTTTTSGCNGASPQSNCGPAIGHTWPAQSGQGWIYSHQAGGCQANINLSDSFEIGVGGHGGYGAWYCFAL
jgi:hypothetical protein